MKSLTFEALRERSEKKLERTGVPNPAQKLTARLRRRTEQILGERAVIEDLATTQEQREAYGIERWHAEFVRLRDIHSDEHFDRFEGEELQWHVWSKAQGWRFTRFQELFCAPGNFILPRFTLDRRGNVEFHDRPDWHRMSLAPCLVSADRIPDKLMEDLGLCTFTEESGDPMARLAKKRALIPRFKLLWEAAVPLQERQQRMLAVLPPTPEIQSRYPGIAGPPSSALGTILYTRRHENGKNGRRGWERRRKGAPRPPDERIAQHFKGLYDADRKTYHEFHAYAGEIANLEYLQRELHAVNRALDLGWHRDTPEDKRAELHARAEALLQQCDDLLAACVNTFKVEAHDFAEEILQLLGRDKRQNISAVMAKMVGIMNRLQRRFRDLTPKSGRNHEDQTILEHRIRHHERTLKNFRKRIAEGAPWLFEDTPLWSDQPLTAEELARAVQSIEAEVGFLGDPLEEIFLEPFRTYALRLREKSRALDAALRARDPEAAKDTLIEMHVIGKFQAMRTCLEHVKKFTLDANVIAVGGIQRFVRALTTLFSERQLFPERIVPAYQEPFEDLERHLQHITNTASTLPAPAEQPFVLAKQDALCARIRECVDQCDGIEDMVRELP